MFRKLERNVQKRLAPKIESLREDPRPAGFRKLVGQDHQYRIRVGDYRVIYQINDTISMVTVIAATDRKDAYD